MMFRKMLASDYEQVYALWVSCSGMGLNDIDDSADGIGRFLERNPDTCFVAESEGSIVGAILAGHDGRRGHIYHAAVSPFHRRCGIGSALVREVMTAFNRLGIVKTALVVFSENADGNAFWEKLGFSMRDDLMYRDKPIRETVRTDT